MIAFAKPDNIIAMPTKSNEWFTPARYVEAARRVMGSIDLDPASCELANRTVKAKRFYAKEDNGLMQDWTCESMWLNPPYGNADPIRSGLSKWALKAVEEYQSENIQQCIMLVMVRTDQSWFQCIWGYSLCFTDHSIRFYLPNKSSRKSRFGRTTDTHMWASVFVYLGSNNEKFAEVFSEFGPVIPANVAVRRQQITPLSLWKVSND